MQDRFKYRAWDKENKKYIYGVEKGLQISSAAGDLHVMTLAEIAESSKYVLVQCTGLIDKNNKLIYEGNILAVSPDSNPWDCYKVFWQDDECQFQTVSYDGPDAYVELLNELLEENNMAVIGNIHENSELLEEKQ